VVSTLRQQMDAFHPVDKSLADLGELLLTPLHTHLAGFTNIIIIPDGPLYHVPFAALPVGEQALLDLAMVAQAPSGSVLTDQLLQSPLERPSTVAALAPAADLPYARLEAGAVGSPSWVGPSATEEALRALRVDALDLAAHGRLDPNDPM